MAERKKSIRLTHVRASVAIDAIKVAYDAEAGAYRDDLTTDETIAAALPFPISAESVKGLRIDLFGPFKRSGKGISRTDLSRLENDLLILRTKLECLCRQLGVDWQSLTMVNENSP